MQTEAALAPTLVLLVLLVLVLHCSFHWSLAASDFICCSVAHVHTPVSIWAGKMELTAQDWIKVVKEKENWEESFLPDW